MKLRFLFQNKSIAALMVIGALVAYCKTAVATPDPPPPPPECTTNWCEVVEGPTGTVQYTNVNQWPDTNVCLGSYVCAWVDASYTCSEVITVQKWAPQSTNCLPQYSTNSCQWPYIETNWYVLTYGSQSTSAEGSSMCFIPTNCGQGSVTFYAIWKNYDPCTGQPIGGSTISKTANFKVANVQIAEPWKATCTNESTGFTLTNTCGPVTWEIVTNGTGGEPTVSGGTVTAGTNCGSWTVIARSTWDTNCTGSSTVYVVAINSQCAAAIPTNQDRTTIGVGEDVNLSACGTPPGDISWTASGGTLNATNVASVVFTAPDRQANVTITLNHAGGSCTKSFSVVEPASESAITNGVDTYPAGTQGVGMYLLITVAPTTVSFHNVECLEVPGPASNVTGYFTNYSAADLMHHPNPDWIQLDESNKWSDHAWFDHQPPPWYAGSFSWTIPVQWRVVGKTNAASLPNRTQTFNLQGADGTSSVSKLGQSVTRTP